MQLNLSGHHLDITSSIRQHTNDKLTKIKHHFDNIINVKVNGRNKYYSFKSNLNAKNFIYLVEHYKLNKLLVLYPQLQILFLDILSITSSYLVLVFGSYAKYCPKKSSDIDIYIKSKSREIKRKVESLNENVNVKIGNLSKGNPLANEIRKHHIILRGVEEFYGKK